MPSLSHLMGPSVPTTAGDHFYRLEARLLEATLGAEGALRLLAQRDALDGSQTTAAFVRAGGREQAWDDGRGVAALAKQLARRP